MKINLENIIEMVKTRFLFVFCLAITNCFFSQNKISKLYTLSGDSVNVYTSKYPDSVKLIIGSSFEKTISKPKKSENIFDFEKVYYKLDTLIVFNTMIDSYGFVYIPIILGDTGQIYAIGKSKYCTDEQNITIFKTLSEFDFKKYLYVDKKSFIYLNLSIDIGNGPAKKYISIDE